MDLDQVPTRDLIDALVPRLDSCLVLGLTVEKNGQPIYHRHFEAKNRWVLMTRFMRKSMPSSNPSMPVTMRVGVGIL